MAVDISTQLNAIASSENGETVLLNVGSALEAINESARIDIGPELSTIYNGTYGRDIRGAIYDALFKLSIASPGGGGTGVIIGIPTVYMSGTVLPISATIYGTAEEVE